MTTLIEAAWQALEALERCYDVQDYPANGATKQDHAVTALRQAIAEAEQAQPVAWISEVRCIGPEYGKKRYAALPIQSLQPGYYAHTPLYIAPPQRQPLSEEMVFELIEANTEWKPAAGLWRLNEVEFARAIEAAIKEKA